MLKLAVLAPQSWDFTDNSIANQKLFADQKLLRLVG
jgi:hypothetical protein